MGPWRGGQRRRETHGRIDVSGAEDVGTWIDAMGSLGEATAWVDSDWSRDRVRRRSVTSEVIAVGGSVAYTSSKQQCATALLRSEAEYYAAAQGAADISHVVEIAKLFDAPAATWRRWQGEDGQQHAC